jgi:hypothetical protein
MAPTTNLLCPYWNPGLVERDILIICMETLCLLSIFGSFFVFLTYLVFRAQFFQHFYPFWLAVSTFFLSCFILMSPGSGFEFILNTKKHEDQISCQVQAIGIQFFGNATNLWSLVIFLDMHAVIVGGQGWNERSKWLAHLFAWGFSAVLTIVPAVLQLLGPSGPWCWLKCAYLDVWGVTFYLAEMFAIVLVQVVLWIRMYRALRDLRRQRNDCTSLQSASSSTLVKCTWFVWLFTALFLAMACHRILDLITKPDGIVYTLELLDVIASSSMGFLLSFCVFGVTRKNHQLWLSCTPNCFSRIEIQPYQPERIFNSPEAMPLLPEQGRKTPAKLQNTPVSKNIPHQHQSSRLDSLGHSPSINSFSESETDSHYSADSSYSFLKSEGFSFADVEFKTPPPVN